MSPKNYTPIDDLVRRHKPHSTLSSQSFVRGREKEAEPIVRPKEKYEIKEAVEHKPEEEVRPFVQPRAEIIEVPPDLQKMGLQPATTTQFPSFQDVKLPISDEKIIAGLHQPVTSSFRWLATLAVYLLKQVNLALKVVRGKVIRVVSS